MEIPVRCFAKRVRRSWRLLGIVLALAIAIVFLRGTVFRPRIVGGGGAAAMRPRTTTLSTPVRARPGAARTRKAANTSAELKVKWWNERVAKAVAQVRRAEVARTIVPATTLDPDPRVHIFYYAWYENLEHDRKWEHWDHEYLKNWRKSDNKVYPEGRHSPPSDIGSNFYPKLGCYSSRDPKVMEAHMKMIRDAGIGVIVVSWYPPGLSDGRGRSSDSIFLDLLNAADGFGLKVAPHVEPYEERNPINFRANLKYFTSSYGAHPALYKTKRKGRNLPVYYVYDSYRTPAYSWRELFSEKGNITVRGSAEDGVFLGLLVDMQHKHEIKRARFDGFYTYFASNGFSYGSTWKNWKSLSAFARQSSLLFSPSSGPGYEDTRIRPWNSATTRHRRRGKYYDVAWRTAVAAGADFFSVTSFNEWHEGTQIEPAVAKSIPGFAYSDYEPEGPDFYLNLTNWWINRIANKKVT